MAVNKHSIWIFTAALLGGCNATFWANWVVLAITVGIFFGTLSLGKTKHLNSKGDASHSKSSHHS